MTSAPSRFIADGVHIAKVRVYYEDTDAAGIVYYANYLKFAERARTEVLRDLGIAQRALVDSDGVAFAVRRCEVDYLAPARLDDELEVRTTVRAMAAARLDLDQAIFRAADDGGEARELARLFVRIAVINRDGRPTRLPPRIARLLRPLASKLEGAALLHPSDQTTAGVLATANKKRA